MIDVKKCIIGQTVYTVNNKTNKVDSWDYGGYLKSEHETLIHLVRGRQFCFIPARCVFATESEAQEVAKKK